LLTTKSKAQTIILRAAGGIILAGGLCVYLASPAHAAQTTTTKPTTSTKSSSGLQTKKTLTPVKSGSASKSAHKKTGTTTHTAKTKMQMAPTPDRIKEIQSALAASDSYKGEPSGKWDDTSVAAMKHFQQVNGLNPSGKLDALSLQKLGLGSDTAGRGAPRVARPASSAPSSTTPTIQR
jgi:peptidoglycan hydrolase-like protein with peptidoglycan-binding domain